MKMTKTRNTKQIVYTALGILFIIILLGLAVLFPTYYTRFYDKNTLNKVSFTDISINTYETSYETFTEKLYALAEASENKSPLRAVRMNEPGLNPGEKELTKIANKEIKKLVGYGVINEQLKPKLKAKKLTLSERYTIYGKDTLQGISCWKLVYENSDTNVTIYLDEEFHKIFFTRILYKKIPEVSVKDSAFDKIYDTSSAITNKFSYKEFLKQQTGDFYTWWDCIINSYYNLDDYPDKPVDVIPYEDNDSTPPYGYVTFDYKYKLLLVNKWNYGDDNVTWDMGIALEKLIQF